MTSRFVVFVPPSGRHSVNFARHSTTPFPSFLPRRGFPRPTPERVLVAFHLLAAVQRQVRIDWGVYANKPWYRGHPCAPPAVCRTQVCKTQLWIDSAYPPFDGRVMASLTDLVDSRFTLTEAQTQADKIAVARLKMVTALKSLINKESIEYGLTRGDLLRLCRTLVAKY